MSVSVVLCTFNGARFLAEQVNSILNQTFAIHELIISDDASTDNTVSKIKNPPNFINLHKGIF